MSAMLWHLYDKNTNDDLVEDNQWKQINKTLKPVENKAYNHIYV